MREKIKLDKNWQFHKGDIDIPLLTDKVYVYQSSKTQRQCFGVASPNYPVGPYPYPKENWKTVDIPHDYVIEGEVSPDKNEGLGFFDYDNAWYVKKFDIPKEDENKRLTILFDGVAKYATVYLNGCLMKRNFSGYTSFEVDITDVAKFGQTNTLAVYVDAKQFEGWWYEGGGIYRHVWLNKTNLISVDLWGVFVKPKKISEKTWEVSVETDVRNDYDANKSVSVEGFIIDKDGKIVASGKTAGLINKRDIRKLKYKLSVEYPNLWSPDSPTQYTFKTKVYQGKKQVDEVDVKFGFRTVYADPDKGLFINDKHYKIKGVCGHADFGLSGKAVPDNIHKYKVQLLKEMGANGYRCSHYAQASELMDELDSNGFIVMNETRWFESSEEGKAQLEMLVKRDRNRPSVMFWSLGNEEYFHLTEEGRRITKSLRAVVEKLDDTRYIMTAINRTPDVATVCEELDVIGVNYTWEAYEAVHKNFPNIPVLSSENCATGTTRGHYFADDPVKAFITAYDHDSSDRYKSREYTWNFIMERDWMLGGYQWIAFEHRGEAKWPRLCSQSGAIDLFMQKKDAFYQNKSHWTSEPMVYLLPHWNFNGFEGETVKVFAYTNQPKVELFLNGKSLGVKNLNKIDHGEWDVKYEPGVLEVLAYNDDKVVAKDKRVTSGAPTKLMLKLENEVKANGEDLAVVTCYVVDKDGNEVYDASVNVDFYTNELGKIYSTGSDISDHTSIFLSNRKMRAGRITATIKVGETEGELKVYATSNGLENAVLTINLNK